MKLIVHGFIKRLSLLLILGSFWVQPAKAQVMTLKLTEAEVKAAIPVLKAEAASYARQQKSRAAKDEARLRLAQDIQSGKVDPLD